MGAFNPQRSFSDFLQHNRLESVCHGKRDRFDRTDRRDKGTWVLGSTLLRRFLVDELLVCISAETFHVNVVLEYQLPVHRSICL
jgi:hypothetical protein